MTIAKVYGPVLGALLTKKIDFTTDTIKVMLVGSGYTPDQDAHQYKSSVTNEITGTGYTAGGLTLTGKAISYTSGTNTEKWVADNPVWPGSSLTARYAVFYHSTGTDATSELIMYWDFGLDVSLAPFALAMDSAGLLTLVVP